MNLTKTVLWVMAACMGLAACGNDSSNEAGFVRSDLPSLALAPAEAPPGFQHAKQTAGFASSNRRAVRGP